MGARRKNKWQKIQAGENNDNFKQPVHNILPSQKI
jgi:hypothetical protein